MSMEQGPETNLERRISRASVFRWSQDLQAQNRIIIGLLVWVATVMTVLLISLVAGFIWVTNRYDEWRTAVQPPGQTRGGQTEEPITERVIQDFLTRQERFSSELAEAARDYAGRQTMLDQRRAALGAIPEGPIDTAVYAVRVGQLALDEAIALNRNLATLQQVLARNLSLFPSEQTLLRKLRNQ